MDRDQEPLDESREDLAKSFSVAKPFATEQEFAALSPTRVPRGILAETEGFLRAAGNSGVEGVVLWAGRRWEGSVVVERVVIPRQVTGRWHFEVSLEERIRIALSLADGEFVAAQVHTHEREAFHSPTDDRKAIVDRRWALSVVVPDFCRAGLADLSDTAVFALRGSLDWVELTPEQVGALFIYT